MADRRLVSQYVKNWQQTNPSKIYFTDFAGGGVLWLGASHKYHIFTASGSWTSPVTNADVIVVAGGGGTGAEGGGGGAGGVRNLIAATFVVGTTYTVTVGAAGTMSNTAPTAGGNSSITTSGATISATGGGRGGVTAQAAGAGGSGGGGKNAAAGGAGNAGGFTPVEGFAGAAGFTAGGVNANGSGGGGSKAAIVGQQGASFYGNRDATGPIGEGINLPDDLTNSPIFDVLRVPSGTSQYTNTQAPNVAICWGGMGQGYAGNVGFINQGGSIIGGYTGGFSTTYNGVCYGARGFGNGACSGTGTFGNIARGTAGIVIVRYAL